MREREELLCGNLTGKDPTAERRKLKRDAAEAAEAAAEAGQRKAESLAQTNARRAARGLEPLPPAPADAQVHSVVAALHALPRSRGGAKQPGLPEKWQLRLLALIFRPCGQITVSRGRPDSCPTPTL